MVTRLVCCLFLQIIFSSGTMANISTACYGSPVIRCTGHTLRCTTSLVISITNITFGYTQGCPANCGNLTCCREETGDCFTPYNQTLLSQLQQTCNGRSSCTLNRNTGLDERSSYCFNGIPIFHSYSKIEYQCVTNQSTTYNGEFQETTTSGESEGTTIIDGSEEIIVVGGGASTVGGCNETAVVGGVLGTVIVICIIIIVLLVIFFNRKLEKLKLELRVHHNGQPYDSAPNRSRDESSTGNNSLTTPQENGYYNLGRGGQQPNTRQTNSSNNNQHSTIDSGDDHSNHKNKHYEHQYDEAPRGTTDQPAAVYDSLNTREQTGYYNMGNINTVGKDK